MRALSRNESANALGSVPHLHHQSSLDFVDPPVENNLAPILIWETDDIIIARHTCRCLGKDLGCSDSQIAVLTTAISELARNIILYANRGEISISETLLNHSKAIAITARDEGPGIADIDAALAGGYSTSGGLGLGLSGLNQIADDFEVNSHTAGTCVKAVFILD